MREPREITTEPRDPGRYPELQACAHCGESMRNVGRAHWNATPERPATWCYLYECLKPECTRHDYLRVLMPVPGAPVETADVADSILAQYRAFYRWAARPGHTPIGFQEWYEQRDYAPEEPELTPEQLSRILEILRPAEETSADDACMEIPAPADDSPVEVEPAMVLRYIAANGRVRTPAEYLARARYTSRGYQDRPVWTVQG